MHLPCKAPYTRRTRTCREYRRHENVTAIEQAQICSTIDKKKKKKIIGQSRYFECDESDSDFSDSEYSTPEPVVLVTGQRPPTPDDDEEVFVDVVPSDSTSTDLLLDAPQPKMSVSSDESAISEEARDQMQLEMAAGTPVVLDYLLNHPITCAIQ
ncbi:hypothetical protein EVAR_14743_1 [Eumeta japonica]|uniref:Uncharacterized protein n=1 Tax=Eumeta variegata TaxID=151549 RepID=A0A4C1TWI6_EUMVA|nr:hypothetical protein EVAR_14743_1 [Eumeta japonica]